MISGQSALGSAFLATCESKHGELTASYHFWPAQLHKYFRIWQNGLKFDELVYHCGSLHSFAVWTRGHWWQVVGFFCLFACPGMVTGQTTRSLWCWGSSFQLSRLWPWLWLLSGWCIRTWRPCCAGVWQGFGLTVIAGQTTRSLECWSNSFQMCQSWPWLPLPPGECVKTWRPCCALRPVRPSLQALTAPTYIMRCSAHL